MIDLFSDTRTQPSAGMRRFMADAEVGDEQADLDPTVTALCERVAALLGKERAVYLPSGTMCNEIAYRVHCRPGEEIILDRTAHGIIAEAGGPAALALAMLYPLDGERGQYSPEQVERAMAEAHVGFLMAPRHHKAVAHVMGARKELGTRTLFNMLGPLTNPAFVKRQLIGCYSRDIIRPMAEALGRLGSEKAWVVHGSDGLDEMTTTGPTYVVEIDGGSVREFEVSPGDAGLARAKPEDLKGGGPEENANALRRLLDGEKGPYRDITLLNAAGVLVVAGKLESLKAGVELGAQALDSGAAKQALSKLVAITQERSA